VNVYIAAFVVVVLISIGIMRLEESDSKHFIKLLFQASYRQSYYYEHILKLV